ncbi:MAG: hypothetical protein Q8M93_00130 [Polaromonas sp.]|nr:hypothetical protein [Polaromonas sp.]
MPCIPGSGQAVDDAGGMVQAFDINGAFGMLAAAQVVPGDDAVLRAQLQQAHS